MATDKPTTTTPRAVTWEGVPQWITVFIAICSILVGVGYVQAQIDQLDKQTAENTATLKTHEAMFTEIKVQLGQIDTKLGYITDWINKESNK